MILTSNTFSSYEIIYNGNVYKIVPDGTEVDDETGDYILLHYGDAITKLEAQKKTKKEE